MEEHFVAPPPPPPTRLNTHNWSGQASGTTGRRWDPAPTPSCRSPSPVPWSHRWSGEGALCSERKGRSSSNSFLLLLVRHLLLLAWHLLLVSSNKKLQWFRLTQGWDVGFYWTPDENAFEGWQTTRRPQTDIYIYICSYRFFFLACLACTYSNRMNTYAATYSAKFTLLELELDACSFLPLRTRHQSLCEGAEFFDNRYFEISNNEASLCHWYFSSLSSMVSIMYIYIVLVLFVVV